MGSINQAPSSSLEPMPNVKVPNVKGMPNSKIQDFDIWALDLI
jgi:hypothetical protein